MTLEIPEEFEKALGDTPEEARRRALECIAVEGYKAQKLSHRKVGDLLGLNWHETEALLVRSGALHLASGPELISEVDAALRSIK